MKGKAEEGGVVHDERMRTDIYLTCPSRLSSWEGGKRNVARATIAACEVPVFHVAKPFFSRLPALSLSQCNCCICRVEMAWLQHYARMDDAIDREGQHQTR